MSAPELDLLLVASPGEAELAADGLRRALAQGVGLIRRVWLLNNGGIADQADWQRSFPLPGRPALEFLAPELPPPRPYFEIARTVFHALARIAAQPPELLFKIDPDTVVLDAGFFADVVQLHREHAAQFYACHVRSARRDHILRCVRLLADLLPVGVGRAPSADRYGRGLKFRPRPVWYRRTGFTAVRRGRLLARLQPSGGFYAVTGQALQALDRGGLLATHGANGLEWNDDTVLPIAVRAIGGRQFDLRGSAVAPDWRWMHGSRYFTMSQALAPGLRALHPVKLDAESRSLRASLPPLPEDRS